MNKKRKPILWYVSLGYAISLSISAIKTLKDSIGLFNATGLTLLSVIFIVILLTPIKDKNENS